MPNIKISPKGRALLKRGYSSSKISSAIVRGGNRLSAKEGMIVNVNGKSVRLKAASALVPVEIISNR
jgi:hypothetical protein